MRIAPSWLEADLHPRSTPGGAGGTDRRQPGGVTWFPVFGAVHLPPNCPRLRITSPPSPLLRGEGKGEGTGNPEVIFDPSLSWKYSEPEQQWTADPHFVAFRFPKTNNTFSVWIYARNEIDVIDNLEFTGARPPYQSVRISRPEPVPALKPHENSHNKMVHP